MCVLVDSCMFLEKLLDVFWKLTGKRAVSVWCFDEANIVVIERTSADLRLSLSGGAASQMFQLFAVELACLCTWHRP